MGKKLKDLSMTMTPSPTAYELNIDLTKNNAQRTISFNGKRQDFSKSVTGSKVGPGSYFP